MVHLVYFVLFLALTSYSSGALYCVCKDGLGDQNLQKAIDYACGAGADCIPILQNGACFNPNTVKDHCSYAVNSYFQRKGQAQGTCDFAGAAVTSPTPPPTSSSSCVFPSSPGNTTGGGTTTSPTTNTPGISPPSTITPTTPSTGTGGTGTGTGTTPTGTGTGTGFGTGTGTGTGGMGTGTGTGTTTGSPNVFGMSPASSTGTGGFNDSSNGMVHLKNTYMLLFSFVLTLWLVVTRV